MQDRATRHLTTSSKAYVQNLVLSNSNYTLVYLISRSLFSLFLFNRGKTNSIQIYFSEEPNLQVSLFFQYIRNTSSLYLTLFWIQPISNLSVYYILGFLSYLSLFRSSSLNIPLCRRFPQLRWAVCFPLLWQLPLNSNDYFGGFEVREGFDECC